ncbi:peptidase M50 [Phragmitibacter flavus]|uniref:Peptidase M50 n=1 Tax=Phragmitibacter flavus TaxID=2576071 RepID=A0A5R8KI68_9BACT|nr:peptidase M50 [Phragmitibacter flavus]TLD71940.1 peptidase M50 [Phragmitibacter flavus]
MNRPPTFDESWHRVEDRRVCLRPGVEIFPQRFRGMRWYVVQDSLGNRFFRIRPPAYRFICELERSGTVGGAWERSLKNSPEEAPGQGEVVQLLSQLHQSGLLRSDLGGDVTALFEAQQKEQRRQVTAQWANLFFLRIPLINPDRFLQRTLPAVGWLISKLGLVIWLLLLVLGVKAVAENWQQFRAESGGLLGAANLPWLYAAIIVIKGLHEYGHGYFCRKFGGEVPQMGIMLLLFNPLPYVDASSSWAFREKSKRALVGAAGMIVEILLASVAAIVWANTREGIEHAIAYNVIIIASVGTLLFNLNPLLRFDGYHILSDLLEVPNLQSRASRTALYLLEKYVFRVPNTANPAETRVETFWLTFYFVASFIYRILLLVGILLLVSGWFFIIGILLAIGFFVLWLVVPVFKAIKYLLTSPRLEGRRHVAAAICLGLVMVLGAAISLVPMPSHFRANGVIRSDPFARVYAGSAGDLVEMLVPSGTVVVEGQPLVRMVSFDLDQEIKLLQLDLRRLETLKRDALETDPVRHLSLQEYQQALVVRQQKLADQKASLLVRAPVAGRWISPELGTVVGATLQRGTELGVVQGEEKFYMAAVVRQAEVARLFGGNIQKTGVKVRGQEAKTLAVSDLQAIPADHPGENGRQNSNQPQAQGVAGMDAGRQAMSSEPFFEVRAFLVPDSTCMLVHGQQGIARLDLPWEPLLSQWLRSLRQLFQRNYRV